MSLAASWALSIATTTIITGITLGIILLNRNWQPPKWASWPTEYLRNQIQRIIDRVKEKNQ